MTMTTGPLGVLLASAVIIVSLSPALAQSSEPSDYLRNSCNADFKRLCGKVTPGKGRISACMKEKEAELSPGCREAMNSPEGKAQGARY